MKRTIRFAILLLLFCFLSGCQKPNDDLDPFRVAALVGDERLSHDVLFDALGITREETPYHYQLYLQALDDYINFFLIRQEFERHGLEVSKEMFDEAEAGEIRKAGSPEALDEKIKARHWTRQYFEDSLKAEVAANILVTRFPKLANSETASNDKLSVDAPNGANVRQVRELFLKKDSKQTFAAAEQSARNLLAYIQSGVSMEVAAQVSGGEKLDYRLAFTNGIIEPSSRAARLGLLSQAECSSKETLLKLATSPEGWHILRVTPISSQALQLLEQKAKDKLSLEQGRKTLIENLRKNTFVEILQLPVRPIDKLPGIRY